MATMEHTNIINGVNNVKVKGNKPKAISAIKYIQTQYDQVFKFASDYTQSKGIDVLCVNWHSVKADAAIINLRKDLNGILDDITRSYRKVINKLNERASTCFKGTGGSWTNISFKKNNFKFNTNKIGKQSDDVVYNETAITEAIGRVIQFRKNIEKNFRESYGKFSNNIRNLGIDDYSPDFMNTFTKEMKNIEDDVYAKVKTCVGKLNMTKKEQQAMLKKLSDKYNSGDIETTNNGWTRTNEF